MTSLNYSIMLVTPFHYSMRNFLLHCLQERKLGTINSVLSYWEKMNQQPWNVSAVFILSFFPREMTHIIKSMYSCGHDSHICEKSHNSKRLFYRTELFWYWNIHIFPEATVTYTTLLKLNLQVEKWRFYYNVDQKTGHLLTVIIQISPFLSCGSSSRICAMCIASRYVHRNVREACEHTLVHDCALKMWKFTF